MIQQNWRTKLHTFSDEKQQIFTVTNAPPIIPHLATSVDADTLGDSSLGSLLRPQINIGYYPELPFLLRSVPVGDPLLSRLCVDPATLTPERYEGGWALADTVRQAWMSLEKGLLYVSELLLTSVEQSSCGTDARYAIRHQPHWSHPADSGYSTLHKTAQGAQMSIRRAHLAFQLLIARCSLAIALWRFPAPRDGHVPEVRTSHYNYDSDEVVPDWVAFLTKKGVPSSWIDTLCDSVISDFSFNLRVGAVFDPKDRITLPLTPVLRAANIPVFILWRSPEEIISCAHSLPFMKSFAPVCPGDFFLALANGPKGKPHIMTLCRDGHTRACPDFVAVDEITPPFGPYQYPGESRADFFARRERFRSDQIRQESQTEMKWRHERTAHAMTGLPPHRRSRVYLWVNAQILFPDLPPRWYGQEYRYPIPPSAYRSIWIVHPEGYRLYNPFFDEWDLWFPPGWGKLGSDDFSEVHSPPVASELVPSRSPIQPMVVAAQVQVNDDDVHHILDLDMSLFVQAPDHEPHDMVFPSNYHLGHWYGISITDSRIFPGVDYTMWARRLPQIFSEMAANLPQDPEQQSVIAGWVSAMLAGDLRSRALMHTWDLDSRNSSFLLHDREVRSCIALEHVGAPKHVEETDNVVRWVLVKFSKDADNIRCSILTTAMGALWLIRRLSEADTSRDATNSLLAVGIPFRTGLLLNRPPPPVYALPLASRRRLLPPWRKQGHRPTVQDYESYCQRVLELAARPHARRDKPLGSQGDADDGPSIQAARHLPVTIDKRGEAFYDDGLSLEELDIIAGVVKVYTGVHSQTEDASWWPKHSAWVRGGAYTGIWTPWQEHWFEERLKGIRAGRDGPLNATEWKDRLKGFKKAGNLADRVDKASWDFTFRNFVQRTDPQ
uniref:Transcriptional regulator containing an aminotransferase domain n=1 Tax=Ganoderma boninense TaxID=34458 RepID=A0A5K1K5S1_9APHY|nr:Putative transcriptional regulator containing an aminotransferase domain [Ganoderma boninense]